MYRAPAVAACLVIALAVGTASQQAAEPILYTEARTTPSTIRDRGPSYAPTYLIYADKQRTADESRQLVDALGMLPHLDEYKARAFVVGPVDNSAYGPGDLAAFQNLLRTHRSSNLKIIGIGAGATFVNNIIATHAFAVAGILTYRGYGRQRSHLVDARASLRARAGSLRQSTVRPEAGWPRLDRAGRAPRNGRHALEP